jgi:hypothetical protein
MQRGFTKLFNTIVTSTIWQEDDKTRIVWITMLAIADHDGIVSAAVPGLASVAHVDIPSTEKALQNLSQPDEYSRTQDYDGRRIESIEGGWLILNYDKYRKMLSEEERKEYKAKWIKAKRRQMSTVSTDVDGSRRKSTVSSASVSLSDSLSSLPEGVRGRFEEWMPFRRAQKKCKDFDGMFLKQIAWLKQFSMADQIEIIDQSIRNGWQGLFRPKKEKQGWEDRKKRDPNQDRLDLEYEQKRQEWEERKRGTG